MSTATTATNGLMITCPKCKTKIPITDALSEQATNAIKEDLNRKAQEWVAEKTKAAGEEAAELRASIAALTTQLTEAQKQQADAIRRQTELDAREREMDLTVAKRVQQEAAAARAEAARIATEEAGLKVAERDDMIRNLQETIRDLNQRAQQGSQQNQGEAQEVVLEQTLGAAFPMDVLTPVAKGQFGGDVLHVVMGRGDEKYGAILWESKRTKNWEPKWIGKLKGDQRAAKAEAAVIATQAIPDGMTGFALIDGVWVCEFRYSVPLAVALRQYLIDLAAVRASRVGVATKAEEMYEYLTGTAFRQRVMAVMEKLAEMQKDLAAEKTAVGRMWAKREGQLAGAAAAMAGMFGDMQAIAGRELLEGGTGMSLGDRGAA